MNNSHCAAASSTRKLACEFLSVFAFGFADAPRFGCHSGAASMIILAITRPPGASAFLARIDEVIEVANSHGAAAPPGP